MFKQLSNRVSAKTIEETFTDLDVEHVKDKNGEDTTDISLNYNPNTGFTFDFPQRWLNEENEFKAIGIRRLKVIPTSHVFSLQVVVKYKEDGVATTFTTGPMYVRLTITSDNSLEEIIHNILDTLNGCLYNTALRPYEDENVGSMGDFMTFTYTFDYKTGDLSLKLEQVENVLHDFEVLQFKIEGTVYGNLAVENLNYFLKFLNQERTEENRKILTEYSESKNFTNVWDRVSLQFHASFSNNKRNFIGLNGDFYECPSIFYDGPTNASDFWVKFTTDVSHQFLPIYSMFYIGISFVRNYKNSLVTK